MNHYDALKLLALRAVMKPDGDAHFRSICRWYSITFHTPLHMVEEIPEEDILIAYYEKTYEDMEDPERQELLKVLLETEEEKKAKARAKDIEDAEAFAFTRRLAAEEKERLAKAKLTEVKPIERKPSMLSAADRRPSQLPQERPPQAFEKLEPDVAIKFVDAADFEKELEGFGMMSPKEGK
jgi:hypothetical protein